MKTSIRAQLRLACPVTGLALLVSSLPLAAQSSDLTLTNKLRLEVTPPDGNWLEARTNGVLIGRSTGYDSSLLSTDLPNGTESALFLWNPGSGQFRAGRFSIDSSEPFGDYSAAFGVDTYATGWGSLAFGVSTVAGGPLSFAGGEGSVTEQDDSLAFGFYPHAVGSASVALGTWTIALGDCSTAFGENTFAGGRFSTAMGAETFADAFASTAIGYLNMGGGDPENWVGEDPLFEIGNGYWHEIGYPVRSNALTVYKNGDVKVTGVIRTTAPAGDIPMFEQP